MNKIPSSSTKEDTSVSQDSISKSIPFIPSNPYHGYHFWVWAIIRILIVLSLIGGAFILGIRIGIESIGTIGYYGDTGRHRNMMPEMGSQKYVPKTTRNYQDRFMSMNMMDMSTQLQGKTGDDLNRAFLEMMIVHHQGAVDMAKYLAGSNKSELVKLGGEIIVAQTKEIELMKKWQKDWGYISSGSTNTGSMPAQMMMR